MDDRLSIDMSVSVECGESVVVVVNGVNVLITASPALAGVEELSESSSPQPPAPQAPEPGPSDQPKSGKLPPPKGSIRFPGSSIAAVRAGVLQAGPIYILPVDEWETPSRAEGVTGDIEARPPRFQIADVAEVMFPHTPLEVTDVKTLRGGFGQTLG